MGDTPEAVRRSIRIYLFIGAILFLGTIITVAVATVPSLDFGAHGFDIMDCALGLTIASVKATLVAAIFMHLNHERKAVYWIFGSGLITVIGLFGLTMLAKEDPLYDPYFYSTPAAHVNPPTGH